MFSRMRFGSFAMRPKRTITMLTACRDVLLLVNGRAFIMTESFERMENVHKSKENASSLEICYLCPERIHPHCTSLQLAWSLLQHWRPWQILAVLDTPLEKKSADHSSEMEILCLSMDTYCTVSYVHYLGARIKSHKRYLHNFNLSLVSGLRCSGRGKLPAEKQYNNRSV